MACPFPFLDSFLDYRKSNKKRIDFVYWYDKIKTNEFT